jgi:AAA domain
MDVPVVTQEMEKQWRSAIQNEVKAIRERRRNFGRDVRPTKRIKICDNKSDLLHMEGEVIQEVKAKYGLDEDQSRAYDIFLNHLKSVEYGPSNYLDESDNRCMYLGGAGGTGKSRVIRAIIEAFRVLGKSEKLLVSATTGAPAQLINGSTIDALCKFNRTRKGGNEGGYGDNGGHLNTENDWMGCQFLIIDEISMLGCHKLRRISKALRRFKGNTLPVELLDWCV